MLAPLIRIVRATSQLQVIHRRRAALCEWHHMVKLEKSAFAATTISPNERALAAIAGPDFTPDGRRHMTTTMVRRRSTARPLNPRESLALEALEQQRERTIEDDRRISVGHDMTQEILDSPKFVVRLAIDGELHLVSRRRQVAISTGVNRVGDSRGTTTDVSRSGELEGAFDADSVRALRVLLKSCQANSRTGNGLV